jgi:3-hydroxyisobutyrate dehydrogenase
MKIGIAGIGRMGAAIAARLASVGHEMMVWNRNADKARATGLKVAETPQALAEGCEAVISIVTDAPAVLSLYEKLLAGKVSRKLFIEMSTVRPKDAQKIASLVKQKQAAFVECPVGGTIGPAREGKLFGFAGADQADFERARPLLEQMCRRVEHLGPAGAGSSMKLAINLPLLVYWQALGESLSLVKHLGLDPARVMDILGDTSGAPRMLQNRAPAIAAALGGKEGPTTVDIDTLKKDLGEMVEEAKLLGWSAPAAEGALRAFQAASTAGIGGKDCVQMPVFWSGKPKKA